MYVNGMRTAPSTTPRAPANWLLQAFISLDVRPSKEGRYRDIGPIIPAADKNHD